jgi:hypothetical protein
VEDIPFILILHQPQLEKKKVTRLKLEVKARKIYYLIEEKPYHMPQS